MFIRYNYFKCYQQEHIQYAYHTPSAWYIWVTGLFLVVNDNDVWKERIWLWTSRQSKCQQHHKPCPHTHMHLSNPGDNPRWKAPEGHTPRLQRMPKLPFWFQCNSLFPTVPHQDNSLVDWKTLTLVVQFLPPCWNIQDLLFCCRCIDVCRIHSNRIRWQLLQLEWRRTRSQRKKLGAKLL